MLPWSVINFIQGDRELGFKIAVLYVVLAISRQIIEPQVTGKQIGLRPIYTFLATILGSLVLGPFGVILGPVIAIIGNSIYRRRLEYYEDK